MATKSFEDDAGATKYHKKSPKTNATAADTTTAKERSSKPGMQAGYKRVQNENMKNMATVAGNLEKASAKAGVPRGPRDRKKSPYDPFESR